MRIRGLDKRDLFATAWVGLAVTLLALVRAGADVPGLRHERALAGALLVLGALACGTGARDDAVTSHGVTTPSVAALRVLGAVLLMVGIGAVASGVPAVTTALAAGTVAMWFGATVRHALLPPTTQAPQAHPDSATTRTKEMSS